MPLKATDATEIHYSKNFIAEVVARVDFLNPIEGIEKKLSPKISSKIKQHFKIPEPQPVKRQEVQFSDNEPIFSKESEFTSWNFHGIEREKTFTI